MEQLRKAVLLDGTRDFGKALARCALRTGYHVKAIGHRAQQSMVDHGLPTEQCRRLERVELDELVADPAPQLTDLVADLVVWTAAKMQREDYNRPLPELGEQDVPMDALDPGRIFRRQLEAQYASGRPLQVIVVSSAYSTRLYNHENWARNQQAAIARFTRVLGQELPRRLPGSRVLLVHPGGLHPPYLGEPHNDERKDVDLHYGAGTIWEQAQLQAARHDRSVVEQRIVSTYASMPLSAIDM